MGSVFQDGAGCDTKTATSKLADIVVFSANLRVCFLVSLRENRLCRHILAIIAVYVVGGGGNLPVFPGLKYDYPYPRG